MIIHFDQTYSLCFTIWDSIPILDPTTTQDNISFIAEYKVMSIFYKHKTEQWRKAAVLYSSILHIPPYLL